MARSNVLFAHTLVADLALPPASASAPVPVAAPGSPSVGIAPAPAAAASSAAATSAGTEFRPVDGGGETKSGEALLVASYAVIWVLVLVFVASVWRRTRAFEARVERLEQALDRAPKAPPSGGAGG